MTTELNAHPRIRLRTVLLLVLVGAVLALRAYRSRVLRQNADEFYAAYGRR